MKASSLILAIQEKIDKYGDLEIAVVHSGQGVSKGGDVEVLSGKDDYYHDGGMVDSFINMFGNFNNYHVKDCIVIDCEGVED